MRSEKESDATEENRRETNNSTHMHSYTLLNDISNAKHVNSHDYLLYSCLAPWCLLRCFAGNGEKHESRKYRHESHNFFSVRLHVCKWCDDVKVYRLICFVSVLSIVQIALHR